jgi:hypothetical protein
MIPDNQFKEDFITGLLLTIGFLIVYYSLLIGGAFHIEPSHDCAQQIKETLSPYRQVQMTGSHNYNGIHAWCEVNVDTWEDTFNRFKALPSFN